MRYRPNVSVTYDVQVRIGGLSLVLLAAFGGGRSVHGILFGGDDEWVRTPLLEPWPEREKTPLGQLLGGALKLGEEVEIDWE